jgi:hypothetical protein
MQKQKRAGFLLIMIVAGGCCPFSVTAVSEAHVNNGCWWQKDEGIPFYLPKPLLVISKNFQYIEESTVGLTEPVPIPNSFDAQDKYASLNSQAGISTTSESPSPPAQDGQHKSARVYAAAGGGDGKPAPSDACCSTQILHSTTGIPTAPTAVPPSTPFFTYQVIFVPDLTQKHYLRIKGGPGEVRATLNMVNGWMFTGLGPFYFKDSSTAQNILATGVLADFAGAGASDVLNGVANLSKLNATTGKQPSGLSYHTAEVVDHALKQIDDATRHMVRATVPCTSAEIHVFEPYVTPEGGTAWHEIAGGRFNEAGPINAAALIQMLGQTQNNLKEIATSLVTADVQAQQAAARPVIQEWRPPCVAPAVQLPVAPTGPVLLAPALPDPRAADAATERAAVQQVLAPVQPRPKSGSRVLDWLFCRRPQVTNKGVIGPETTVTPEQP